MQVAFVNQSLKNQCIFFSSKNNNFASLLLRLSSNMSWDSHINNISSKTNKILGFLKRNLKMKREHTKGLAYKLLVQSDIEYCSSV